jgi:hypothetical protein
MRVDLDKIATINQWPIPTSLIEVKNCFMGITQYLRKFIENF